MIDEWMGHITDDEILVDNVAHYWCVEHTVDDLLVGDVDVAVSSNVW